MAQSKQVAGATGKSKVISSSTPAGVRGGKGKMFGQQTVKSQGGGGGKMFGKQSVKPAKKA